ncbi:MAG: DUF4255 domain-containing protein [Bacteroidota bacterium]
MLRSALQLVKRELENYINRDSQFADADVDIDVKVSLGNIAFAESESSNLDKGVVISLVNIEEERTLKNVPSYQKSPVTGRLEYFNPPVHLNLYLLFTANMDDYEISIAVLSSVLKFFQSKSIFTYRDSSEMVDNEEVNDIRLVFNIYTMTFEQLNHLWGSLGGKQMPHVMYRVWLVEEKDQRPIRSGGLITDVDGELSSN